MAESAKDIDAIELEAAEEGAPPDDEQTREDPQEILENVTHSKESTFQ